MTAFTFTIRTRERGQLAGQAVVCVDARYASVWWQGQERADRRFLAPAEWKAIQNELDWKLPADPLEDDSVIARALIHESMKGRFLVQYLSQEPISEDEGAPERIILALDQRLRMLQP